MEIQKSPQCYWIEKTASQPIAELTFTKEEEVLTITHTFVDPAYREQGLGAELVSSLVDDARTHKQRINLYVLMQKNSLSNTLNTRMCFCSTYKIFHTFASVFMVR